jgi:hypothetical protein
MFRFATTALLGLLMTLQCSYAATSANEPVSLDSGFHQMYNLDFAAAHKTFETFQELHPNDPLGAASNAAAYLFSEFERLHILELDLFTDNQRLENLSRDSADPKVKAAFDSELAKADDIAKRVLSESADDRNALFARLLAEGLRGDYAVLIEKRNRAGLGFLQSSRSIAEKLIAIDPTYSDAYLAIGIENYLLGLRSAPSRWLLRLSGSQTNKEKGIDALKRTAEEGRYLKPYARLLMAIAALRDRDNRKAKQILAELAKEFPQNPLYRLELARIQS